MRTNLNSHLKTSADVHYVTSELHLLLFPKLVLRFYFCQGVFLWILPEHKSMKWISHCICLMSGVPAAQYHWLATVPTPGTGSRWSICHLPTLHSCCCLEGCTVTHHCWVLRVSLLAQVPSTPKGPAVGLCYRIKVWSPATCANNFEGFSLFSGSIRIH